MSFWRIFKLRTRLRELLGVSTLESRLHEVEGLVRLWASRSGEATALDLLVSRIDDLISQLPADPTTQHLAASVRSSFTVRDRAAEIALLHQRLDQLEARLLESQEETRERSRERWRRALPDDRLTWMKTLSGAAFVDQMVAHQAFGPNQQLLEVGPGYGRLLREILARNLPFASYLGVDISANNVAELGRQFRDPRLSFVHADVEEVTLPNTVDVIYSSLTFKHLYPSFERALTHLGRSLNPHGKVIFDLVEGHKRYFELDGVTYLRFYQRDEIVATLARAGFALVAFAEVWHDPEHPRLLVICQLA